MTWQANQTWGLDPLRRNRRSVTLLLRLLRSRPTRWKEVNRLRRGIRDTIGLLLSSDVRCAHIGESLFLPHPFGIVIHARTHIGDRCTIFQNVTIGEDTVRPGVPVLGDDVIVGAGAAILGPITVGDGARVGANAVVVTDVPAGSVAVGVPASIRPGGWRNDSAPDRDPGGTERRVS